VSPDVVLPSSGVARKNVVPQCDATLRRHQQTGRQMVEQSALGHNGRMSFRRSQLPYAAAPRKAFEVDSLQATRGSMRANVWIWKYKRAARCACWSDVRSTRAMQPRETACHPRCKESSNLSIMHSSQVHGPTSTVCTLHSMRWWDTTVTMQSPGSILHGEWGTWETLPLEVSPSARANCDQSASGSAASRS
jgi:hypothetical protein